MISRICTVAGLCCVLSLSCFNPNYPEGAACGPDEWCPPGQMCIDQVCWRHGAPDAGSAPDVAAFTVRGIAYGVLEPLNLRLEYQDKSELLSISVDGPFEFPIELHAGDSYAVVLADDSPCVLKGTTGVVTDSDPTIELVCKGALHLTELSLSGPTAPKIALAPGKIDYDEEVSLLQREVSVIAVPTYSEASITIAGMAVANGAASPPIALDLGENIIEITVAIPDLATLTYRIVLDRAAGIVQGAYSKASNTDAKNYFGISVALSGDTLVVGAPDEESAATGIGGDQGDNSALASGAVYVFRRTGTSWVQEAYLKASNSDPADYFGISVALSGDTLAVGALGEASDDTGINGNQGNNEALDSGAVYVFRRTGTVWAQEAYLKASNTNAGDEFGYSVTLSGDTLAVGAWLEDSAAKGLNGDQDDNNAQDSGAVYVFRRTGTVWAQEAYLKASNTGSRDLFGISAALSGDALAVGAVGEASEDTGVDGTQSNNSAQESGAVYVFRRTGTSWAQEAYFKASNTNPGDAFGISVALLGDTLAVGAVGEASTANEVDGNQSNNAAPDSGAVYVFRRTGTSWAQEVYLKASNSDERDEFGYSVALSADILAVGADFESSDAKGIGGDANNNNADKSGAAYVFRRTGTSWAQEAYLKASNSDKLDFFGIVVALSADTLAVGAWQEDSAATGVNGDESDNSAADSGAVYVFH